MVTNPDEQARGRGVSTSRRHDHDAGIGDRRFLATVTASAASLYHHLRDAEPQRLAERGGNLGEGALRGGRAQGRKLEVVLDVAHEVFL